MNKIELKLEIIKTIVFDPYNQNKEINLITNDYLTYLDSIRLIELITEVENHFDIEIKSEDL